MTTVDLAKVVAATMIVLMWWWPLEMGILMVWACIGYAVWREFFGK